MLTEQHVSQVERVGRGQWFGRSSKSRAAETPDSGPRCSRCGYREHLQDQCPYKLRGWICRACNTAGHTASMCLARRKQPARKERQQKHLETYDKPNGTFETVKGVLIGGCSEFASEFDLDVRVTASRCALSWTRAQRRPWRRAMFGCSSAVPSYTRRRDLVRAATHASKVSEKQKLT